MFCRLISAVCLLSFAAVVSAEEQFDMPLLFEEDFEKGADNWTATDAKAWKLVETKHGKSYGLIVRKSDYNPPHRSPLNILLLNDVVVGDFILTAKVQSTADTGNHRDMCIFFNYQDPANFYYVHLGKRPDPNSSQIMLVDDAPRRPITKGKSPGVPWTDGWHDVKVVRRTADGTIEIYFDDMKKPIMTAEDKTFQQGQIGLGSFDDTGNWDDVKLYGKKVEKK